MRAVVQRVLHADVTADGSPVACIGRGLTVFLGLAHGDTETDARWMAGKCSNLRNFDDKRGIMNRSLRDVEGELLLVSQFTLLADARKGRRPSYQGALDPEHARELFERCTEIFHEEYPRLATGRFQTDMQVALVNDGPVTILLDSRKTF